MFDRRLLTHFNWMLLMMVCLITAIGMSILLQTLAMIIWKPNPKSYPTLLSQDPIHLGGAVISVTQLTILAPTVIVLSLLNALFFGLHLTGDIVFGIEKGGREILVGVVILAVYLYGAVGLPDRLAGYILLLLGGLGSAALPVVHTMGRPLGERFAQLPGGFLFIWTLLTMGATGLVAFVLSMQAIWSLRRRRHAAA